MKGGVGASLGGGSAKGGNGSGAAAVAANQMRPFTVSPSMDHILKLAPSGSMDSVSSMDAALSDAESGPTAFDRNRRSSLLPR